MSAAMATWLRRLAVVAIIGVAAGLRLYQLDLVPFGSDQAAFLAHARAMLDSGQVPLVGLRYSMLSINTSALPVYVLALPVAVSPDPALATGLVGLANVVAVYLCYRIGARHFGVAAGLLAALLFAASFWAVYHSRKVLDISFHPLWATLLLGALLDAVAERPPSFQRKDGWAVALAVLWLALLVQFHLIAAPFVIVFGLALLLLWRPTHLGRGLGWLAVGGLLALATAAPYLAWELGHGFESTRAFLSLSAGPTVVDATALHFAVQLISTGGFSTYFGPPSVATLAVPPYLGPLRDALAVLFGGGLAYMAVVVVADRMRTRRSRAYALLLLWFFVPTLFHLRYAPPMQLHRFLMLYPVQFLVIAVAVGRVFALGRRWAAERGWTWAGAAGGVVVGVVVVAGLAQVPAFFGFLDWVAVANTTPGYGVPLRYQRQAVELVRDQRADGERVLVGSRGELTEGLAYLSHWLGVPAAFVDDELAVVVPREPTLYLASSERPAGGAFLGRFFGRREVGAAPYPGGADSFHLYRLGDPPGEGSSGWQLSSATWRRLPLVMDNGVRVHAYQVAERATAPGEVALDLLWEVASSPPPGASYRFFQHLVEPAEVGGRGYGDWDGIGFGAAGWRPGDVVVSWHRIPVADGAPLGQYWIEWGLRDDVAGRRVPFTDERSGRRADTSWLGPIKVVPAEAVPPPPPQHARDALFGRRLDSLSGELRLLGYDLIREVDGRRLRLHWRAEHPPQADYIAFVHLLGADGAIVWQRDAAPGGGRYPTSMWDAGEVVVEDYLLPTSALGESRFAGMVEVGWYRPTTLQRLSVAEAGQGPSTSSVVRIVLPLEGEPP